MAGLGAAAIGAVAGAASWMTDLLGADHEYALARTYGTYNGPDPETRREAPSQALVHAKAAAKQAPSEPRYRLEVALASIKLR